MQLVFDAYLKVRKEVPVLREGPKYVLKVVEVAPVIWQWPTAHKEFLLHGADKRRVVH